MQTTLDVDQNQCLTQRQSKSYANFGSHITGPILAHSAPLVFICGPLNMAVIEEKMEIIQSHQSLSNNAWHWEVITRFLERPYKLITMEYIGFISQLLNFHHKIKLQPPVNCKN